MRVVVESSLSIGAHLIETWRCQVGVEVSFFAVDRATLQAKAIGQVEPAHNAESVVLVADESLRNHSLGRHFETDRFGPGLRKRPTALYGARDGYRRFGVRLALAPMTQRFGDDCDNDQCENEQKKSTRHFDQIRRFRELDAQIRLGRSAIDQV